MKLPENIVVKRVIDKVAKMVAQEGIQIENMLKETLIDNSEFAFLYIV